LRPDDIDESVSPGDMNLADSEPLCNVLIFISTGYVEISI